MFKKIVSWLLMNLLVVFCMGLGTSQSVNCVPKFEGNIAAGL